MKSQLRQTNNSLQLTAHFWRWSLAIVLLCGFGLLGATSQVKPGADRTSQSGLVTSADIPLFAHSESLTTAKRLYSNTKDHTGEGENNQPWLGFLPDPFNHQLLSHWLYSHTAFDTLPLVKLHTRQQLNTPRAPPLA